ncbi:hypothetical protein NEIELOOT_03022 [Neisseria elongata subsp. glycolytica ATCC 29315]|uniref:Uncharacterized protein n=1 Tax=Neisseria elongata subsp. glycolytica ATCC 29315 TaxID=546263 RepID=D4DVA5_NEIEG|nr:hypothetical protein NEIELOOT_03022 [Neisseria elongata subsp. glycolytica ATCC 29315]
MNNRFTHKKLLSQKGNYNHIFLTITAKSTLRPSENSPEPCRPQQHPQNATSQRTVRIIPNRPPSGNGYLSDGLPPHMETHLQNFKTHPRRPTSHFRCRTGRLKI